MARYVFQCCSCSELQEEDHPMGEAPQHSRCQKCNHPTVRRFSAPSVTFKGSGFYRTDSRNR